MGRAIKVKGKDALLTELEGKTFDKIEQKLEGGTHQIWFESPEADYVLWGLSCCCDVASIDTVYGDLKDLEGRPIDKAEINGAGSLYLFTTDLGEAATVKWYSKHPKFVDQGVKLTKKVKK